MDELYVFLYLFLLIIGIEICMSLLGELLLDDNFLKFVVCKCNIYD